VKLTRSRDGSSGTATFVFESPAIFEASSELGDITGLYMDDNEGTLTTVDVQAKFVNGKPARIEAKYVMRSAFEWERFMRFMERYAEEKGLGFAGGKGGEGAAP
jgi:photosystem II protein